MRDAVSHDRIMQLAMGFAASKTLLSAVEIGVFGAFAEGPLDSGALRARLGLHERAARDFFDALVALGLLQRDDAGRYSNSEEADRFLDPAGPGYIAGIIEMFNARLYGFWGSLTEALRTGMPQNEAKYGGDLFSALYTDPDRLEGFLRAMTGQSLPVAQALARGFPWETVRTVVDIGTAQGPSNWPAPTRISVAEDSISPPSRQSSRAMWRLTGCRTNCALQQAISSLMTCHGPTCW
jgi:hypothetical protein